jgi:DUF4097 and DUF4098 domain-containing protein YvlB
LPPKSTSQLGMYLGPANSKTIDMQDFKPIYKFDQQEKGRKHNALIRQKNNSVLGAKESVHRNSAQLPSLGMRQFTNVDLTINKQNPFSFHRQTEKLLVVREREREFKEFIKIERKINKDRGPINRLVND